jgi:hypothetical protein
MRVEIAGREAVLGLPDIERPVVRRLAELENPPDRGIAVHRV